MFNVVLLLFSAFEMTLAEGTRFERRFFHQTFATVSFVVTSINKTNNIELENLQTLLHRYIILSLFVIINEESEMVLEKLMLMNLHNERPLLSK